jgi:hypothetical protein
MEIIFKSWKSSMAFDKIHEVSKMQLNVILIARFIMIIISSQCIFTPCKKLIKKTLQKNLSLLKVMHYLTRNPIKTIEIITNLAKNPNKPEKGIIALAKYCSYDTRKRRNFEQEIDSIFSLS